MGPRILAVAFVLGAGVLVAGVILAGPPLMRVSRPTLRAGLKRGLEFYAAARTRLEAAAEDLSDLAAEVREEVIQARNTTPHAAKMQETESDRARA